MKSLILVLLNLSICASVIAQSQNERKVAATQKELFNKIASLDSSLFAAYNSKNLDLMKTYFTNDLEWYQDNGGLIGFETVFINFQSIFNRDYDLKRSLIKESLEVHPIEGYGAIEIGKHQFTHVENGKLETGTFKFLMIWKNENGTWKISRVISYDH
jgi:ketosteroid isomerase-like protein